MTEAEAIAPPSARRDQRNVLVLAACQALYITGQLINATLTGLAGAALAGPGEKALVTLPFSMMIVATAMSTVPASLLMRRVGRRWGFTIGAFLGATGSCISAAAIYAGSFWLLAAGVFVYGLYGGFAQFFRFAAADVARPEFKGKAISLVLAGGVIAAVFGPELAKWANALFAPTVFLGAYVVVAGLNVGAAALLGLLDIPKPRGAEATAPGRPLRQIMGQPVFIVAALGGMIGYSVMSLSMTATPLAIVGHGFTVGDAAFVIQWHALGMFAPSFITGALINRIGVLNVMLAGVGLLIASIVLAVSGAAIPYFWGALVALGLGWNFSFVGASTLLTEAYQPEERAKTQAVNDFLVWGSVATASLMSGAILHYFDWNTVNMAAVPFIAVSGLAILWLKARRASL